MAGNYNATPHVEFRRIKDNSTKIRLNERAPRSIHTPIIFSWAEYGPEEPTLIYGNTIPLTYGDETISLRGKFATHVTPYLNLFLQNANPVLFKRLLPKDIGPKASLRISAEVVEEEFDEYERERDGSFKRDVHDDLIPTGTKFTGYKLRFITEKVPFDAINGSDFSKGRIKTGTLTNAKGDFAERIPLIDLEAPHYGSKGNRYSIRIHAPTKKDRNPMREHILSEDNVYPFRLSITYRSDEKSTPREVDNKYGERQDDFVLKPNFVDSKFTAERWFNDVVMNNYQDLDPPPSFPVKYGPFGAVASYQDNIVYLLKKLMVVEKDFNYPSNDLYNKDPDTEEELFYRFNLFGLTNSDGSPYQGIRFDKSLTDSVRFTRVTDNYLSGASDGTLTEDELAVLVENELEKFNDPDSEYQDLISFPCSAFWDSGFPVSTKYKMGYFISQRPNTVVYISTYVSGERPLSNQEEISRLIALSERIRIFAESDYFKTPTCRATIVNGSARLVASSWKKRVPLTYELANMISLFARGESFRGEFLIDRGDNNTFTLTRDVTSLWMPPKVRYTQWDLGGMWAEKKTHEEVAFLAPRTVYNNDTSVLTSLVNVIILAECETVGYMCHRQFSGKRANKGELQMMIEEWCERNLSNRFAGTCRIYPECYFSDRDNSRGYSWTLRINVWLPMMATVQVLEIFAHDINDLGKDSPAFIS